MGIEDTFITAPWPATGRSLDEYELTGHYARWEEDFRLMASLGVRSARYGVPWHRVNPAAGQWDWTWPDQALGRLLDLGIDPIVDLVHYGVPDWIEGAFLNPAYSDCVVEYARRLAERFAGRVRWYTPLNEPRITAWYCGRLGWWPPYRRGWRGFVEVLLAVCAGLAEVSRALRSVDPEIVLVCADPADVYAAASEGLRKEVEFRQQIGFLALDLAEGRVDRSHSLWDWLVKHGACEAALERMQEQTSPPDIIGLNTYPMFSQKCVTRTPSGIRVLAKYGSREMVERLVDLYWERYRRPLMITETAARGPAARRRAWLEQSVAAVCTRREVGIPVVGYTWWPMYALVAWSYRQGERPAREYLEQMGLWDLQPDASLRRVETPLVDAYRQLVRSGVPCLGVRGGGFTRSGGG